MDKEYHDVRAFHIKFKQITGEGPRHLAFRKLEERIRFMQEELDEFKEAAGTQDLALLADALVDLVYVAKGTAVMMGLPWEALWDDVQRANMEKVIGATHRGNLVDVCKPLGWTPPQTKQVLADAGYTITGWHFLHDDLVHQPTGPAILTDPNEPAL